MIMRQDNWLGIIVGIGLAWGVAAGAAQANGKAAPVPPTKEMVILDPSADPLGDPAVRARPSEFGGMVIDIPPTVIVHRYYYAGDRTFQGPFVPGGPTIVVASHPKTGERLYIPVQMIPGAPRVTYTSRSIQYDYGNQGIDVEFCFLTGRPIVSYRRGKTLHRIASDAYGSMVDASKSLALRSGAAEASHKTLESAKSFSGGVVDRTRDAGKIVATPIWQLKQLPVINWFSSNPADTAQRVRDAEIQINSIKGRNATIDIPTVR
jgi:hypothetical protein